MKRVQVSPGKFVNVSAALVDKAARLFVSGSFTRDDLRRMAAGEPSKGGLILGSPTKPKLRAKRDTAKLQQAAAPAAQGFAGQFVRKSNGDIASPRKRKAA